MNGPLKDRMEQMGEQYTAQFSERVTEVHFFIPKDASQRPRTVPAKPLIQIQIVFKIGCGDVQTYRDMIETIRGDNQDLDIWAPSRDDLEIVGPNEGAQP